MRLPNDLARPLSGEDNVEMANGMLVYQTRGRCALRSREVSDSDEAAQLPKRPSPQQDIRPTSAVERDAAPSAARIRNRGRVPGTIVWASRARTARPLGAQ